MKLLKVFIVLVVASCVFGAIEVYAETTGRISGKVCDKSTGEPIPGASVVIRGTPMGCAAVFDGSYAIINVNPGVYTLSAQMIGYNVMTVDSVVVVADSTTTIDFALLTCTIKIEDVVVCARKLFIDKNITSNHARGGRAGEISYMLDGVELRDCLGGAIIENFNTENYDRIYENEFKDPRRDPLSTFSIDVDKASYSNVRRFINDGMLPPPDAVRIEELINYFSYDYPHPEEGRPFSVTTEVSSCPWNNDHLLAHIGLKGKEIKIDNLPPSNLVFLIDVSGSMEDPDKLPLLKSAFKLLVDNLRDNDRIAIVTYASNTGIVLEPTPGSQKNIILRALDNLHSGGCTAGGAGLTLAYQAAEKYYLKNGNNRIILATDGDFNIGPSSDGEMVRLIEEKRDKGVFITVLGFGMGNLKDSRMEKIADKGNGNYMYIDNFLEAKKALVNEMSGTLCTIAKDVKIQIEFNPAKVKSYRLVGYENRMLNKEDFNDDKKDAGEIGAGHSVTALYEIIPVGDDYRTADVDDLKYQTMQMQTDSDVTNELMTVKLRYKEPDGDKSKLIEYAVGDKAIDFKKASDNFKFSAAVAEYGMILRDSKLKGSSSLENAIKIAEQSKGEDKEGYRSEFIQLAKTCQSLAKRASEE